MPGSFIFRPIEAELREDKGLVHKMDPYCKAVIGKHHAKSRACKEGGKRPHWDDAIIVEKDDSNNFCDFELKDDNVFNPNRKIGRCRIDLLDVEKEGQITKWYPLFLDEMVEGRVLMEITYTEKYFPSQDVRLNDDTPRGEVPNDM